MIKVSWEMAWSRHTRWVLIGFTDRDDNGRFRRQLIQHVDIHLDISWIRGEAGNRLQRSAKAECRTCGKHKDGRAWSKHNSGYRAVTMKALITNWNNSAVGTGERV